MRVVVSGGGTAGHITPALSVASYLQDNDVEVFYAGTPQGPEGNLARNAGLSFKAFEASGFNRTKPLTIVKGVRLILKSTRAALCWFEEIKPDVVVGFGGYVSIPVARAAQKMRIPVVLHEQNSVMGLANKYLSKHAQKVCLTYEYASRDVADKSKIVLTGNPVRKEILTATRKEGRAMLG
ncbi:MAG: glycosyltransferase, partial [Eggerthellaceae bacterium]|nr:glycosyltransferase [Eggerthellaceae bacterium]